MKTVRSARCTKSAARAMRPLPPIPPRRPKDFTSTAAALPPKRAFPTAASISPARGGTTGYASFRTAASALTFPLSVSTSGTIRSGTGPRAFTKARLFPAAFRGSGIFAVPAKRAADRVGRKALSGEEGHDLRAFLAAGLRAGIMFLFHQ